jgi:hypothetical protein
MTKGKTTKTKSRGSAKTQLSRTDWRTNGFLHENQSGYQSRWRVRKAKRAVNNYNYTNNINTPATNMMRQRNINPDRNDATTYFSKKDTSSHDENKDKKNRELTIQHRSVCSDEWVSYVNNGKNTITFREFLEQKGNEQ